MKEENPRNNVKNCDLGRQKTIVGLLMGLFTVKQTLVGLFDLVFKNKMYFFYFYIAYFLVP